MNVGTDVRKKLEHVFKKTGTCINKLEYVLQKLKHVLQKLKYIFKKLEHVFAERAGLEAKIEMYKTGAYDKMN